MESRVSSLKRQLDQKWRAVDDFEIAVKRLQTKREEWRGRFQIKDGELEAAKVSVIRRCEFADPQARNAELAQQISSTRTSSPTASSSQLRSLTERATAAERRAAHANNQLAALEARIAELQSKAGLAENKWEARVKEYENRLRIAGEKIKTEKQGGKERAVQLESQVRDLERQVNDAKRRNQRAEGVVASAAHLMQDDH